MSVFRFPSHAISITQTTTFGYLNPPSKASGIAVAIISKDLYSISYSNPFSFTNYQIQFCWLFPTSKLYLNSSQISIHNTLYFHTQKKLSKTSGVTPMPRPLPTLNPCPDFHAAAEGKYHPAVRIDRCVIHKSVEQLLVEIMINAPRTEQKINDRG